MTVRGGGGRQRNYSVFPRGLNVRPFCFCSNVPDFQIAAAPRANSKNSADSCTARAEVRALASSPPPLPPPRRAHVFSSTPEEHCIRRSARGDGGCITCRARTTAESLRQTQNTEGITRKSFVKKFRRIYGRARRRWRKNATGTLAGERGRS